jgi:hypothetical protein
MEKTDMTVFAAKPTAEENVLPRTLVVKPLTYKTALNVEITFAGVYGGQDGDIWCATFYDNDEAQAWIIASNHFGRPMLGAKVATNDTAGIHSGDVLAGTNETGGGSGGKTH